ncbi:MAG: hypothetical protein ACT4P6_01075 [Gemmatimonadaceae bacterium]
MRLVHGINLKRVVLGGVVAAIALWLLESAASSLYLNRMQSALVLHGIMLEPSIWLTVMSVAIALLTGLTMVFMYAVARSRLGTGARTATVVACIFWLGGYVPSLLSYEMIGIYPRTMLYQWGLVGLLEMIIAAVLGAWLYREPAAA